MSLIPSHVLRMLDRLRNSFSEDDARRRLSPDAARAAPPRIRPSRHATNDTVADTWSILRSSCAISEEDQRSLADPDTLSHLGGYSSNIENMIGTVKIPVGLVGPMRINGLHANGDFYIPLATTEAALVASYARGADLVSRAGGASAALLAEGVLRAPGFAFETLTEAGLFVEWVTRNADDLQAAAESTTRHGKLVSIEPFIDTDTVFLLCRYTTGDASGQNMVTIATEALCQHIVSGCPIRPRHWFIEANFSGDKKASHLGLISGRGRKVTASVILSPELVEKGLHTTIERMLDYAKMANLGALLSGQIGAQGHYANGLAAFYIATGQDAACVSESAVGFTRMEAHRDGLFVSVTMPNILVGSVGGGTGLVTQSACLNILGLKGSGNGSALAEVVASLCLAGEISIIGALSAGHFTRAHRKLARDRK